MTKKGFTLVEVLLVSTLAAGISLAVFLCLSNGLKLWDRSRILAVEEDAAIFFDRFSSEMRNSFPFSTLRFQGELSDVAFPTIVFGPADRAGSRASEGYVDGFGRVRYVFDASSGALLRRQANYSQALLEVWGNPQTVVKGLKRARFRYCSAGTQECRLSQDESLPFPAGIEVELALMSGTDEKVMKRFVAIPAGL